MTRTRRQRRLLWSLATLVGVAACGVQPVELLPGVGELDEGGGDMVIGEVPAAALAQLRAHKSQTGAEALELIYPEAPELIVPADLAAISFEWRQLPKAKAGMPMPGAPPNMMPAEMPEPDPAPPEPMPKPPMDAGTDKAEPAMARDQAVLAYELRAHGAVADVRLYTSAEAATFGRARWRELLRDHVGRTLILELRAVRRDGSFVHAAPLSLNVRPALPAGNFYSFSTTAQGVTRAQLSDTHEAVLREPAAVAPAAKRNCIGCHALSRDGRRALAVSAAPPVLLSWPIVGPGQASDAQVQSITLPGASAGDYVLASFDPTAARIAATLAGGLYIFDADTGQLMQQSPGPRAEAQLALDAPDWSPDGRSIAVVTHAPSSDMPEPRDAPSYALATLHVGLDASLSAPETLVTAGKDEGIFAPAYSPDGEWIVYEKRKGVMRGGKDGKLFIVRATGGSPIELRALNAKAKGMDGPSSPAFVRSDQPQEPYLLFSARRAVGSFMPVEGQRQLFAAALDLSLAEDGKDPSHTAFWLPFQQRDSSYQQVRWAPASTSCTPAPEVCDEVDNNCDGVVDEDCCEPSEESCDERDNDCDGAIDEGCGCEPSERCDNQHDDDCDLRIDEQPCMPAPPTMP